MRQRLPHTLLAVTAAGVPRYESSIGTSMGAHSRTPRPVIMCGEPGPDVKSVTADPR